MFWFLGSAAVLWAGFPVLLTLLTVVPLKFSGCLCEERAGFGTEQINDKSSVGVTCEIFPTEREITSKSKWRV